MDDELILYFIKITGIFQQFCSTQNIEFVCNILYCVQLLRFRHENLTILNCSEWLKISTKILHVKPSFI